ncbi:hypothetical protein HanIR_Chr01g0026091 [Helianthus annuus]|nr:hypothetical protein HanIR_Chr01g0026091 [Helianthus annuus]
MEFDDPEPAVVPEPVVAPDPAFEHDPDHADAPAVATLIDDIPVDGHPVVAPLMEDDHAAHILTPHVADIPADPVVAPLPDPVPVQFDHATFTTHVDPRYAHTRNGWIDADNEYPPFVVPVTPVSATASAPIDAPLFPAHVTDAHRADLPVTFLQDIPPLRLERVHPVSLLVIYLSCQEEISLYLRFLIILLFPLLHHLLCHPSLHLVSRSYGLRHPLCHHLILIILTTWVILRRIFSNLS